MIIIGPHDGDNEDDDAMRKPLGPPQPRASETPPVRKRAPQQQQRPGFIEDAEGRIATDGYPLPEAPKPKWR